MADTEYTINIETQPEYTLEIGTLPGAINWGVIEGLLSLQTDLQSALNEKTNNESYTSFVTSTTESLATISSTLDTKATTSTLASHTTEMATTTQNGHMTTTQVITLTNSADIDLSNLTTIGKAIVSNLGMPSDSYIDLTLGASDSTYTAPADGYVGLSKAANASGQTCALNVNTSLGAYNRAAISGEQFIGFVPVKKDDIVKVTYDFAGVTHYFRFIYAEGSQP